MKTFAPGFAALFCAWLAACATPPAYEPHPGDRVPTPAEVVAGARVGGGALEWGGTIIDVRNLARSTEIEVLAYPLGPGGRPDPEAGPLGRFVAVHSDFLEPAEYAPGRKVTVYGRLNGVREGRIGGSQYRFPALAAEQVHLWPRERRGSDVRFGIGVGIGL